MFQVDGEGVLLDLFLVQVAPAEIGIAADPGHPLAVDRRHAVVGQVVVALVEVAQGQAGVFAKPQGQ
ncbi:hypothetical protein D9M70_599190 [compost metagenome]